MNAAAYTELRAFRSPIVTIHEYGFFVLVAMIFIHIAAAVIVEFKEGGAIVSSMFTGRKIHIRIPEDLVESEVAAPELDAEAPR